jgi:AcrR family transcriptional regulator
MAARRNSHPAHRRPRQARGHRRVQAILNAAAAVVAERGVAGVTVHGIARRARTAIGSMYHFFPDRESLMRALADRHAFALQGITDRLRADAGIAWARLSPAAAIGRLFDPFLAHLERHPDFLLVMRSVDPDGRQNRRHPELGAIFIELVKSVLALRMPAARPRERALRATTLFAITDGVLTAAAGAAAPERALLLHELKQALIAYLRAHERRGQGRP